MDERLLAGFFGLKLHIVINDRGELIAFKMTSGKQNDAKAGESIMQKLHGLMFGDKRIYWKSIIFSFAGERIKAYYTRSKKYERKTRVLRESGLVIGERSILFLKILCCHVVILSNAQ